MRVMKVRSKSESVIKTLKASDLKWAEKDQYKVESVLGGSVLGSIVLKN